jgi:hypothetical protein
VGLGKGRRGTSEFQKLTSTVFFPAENSFIKFLERSRMAVRARIRNSKLCDSRNHLETLELHLGNSDCF